MVAAPGLCGKVHPAQAQGPSCSWKCCHLQDRSCQRHTRVLISSVDPTGSRFQSIFTCLLQSMPRSCHRRQRVNTAAGLEQGSGEVGHLPPVAGGCFLGGLVRARRMREGVLQGFAPSNVASVPAAWELQERWTGFPCKSNPTAVCLKAALQGDASTSLRIPGEPGSLFKYS